MKLTKRNWLLQRTKIGHEVNLLEIFNFQWVYSKFSGIWQKVYFFYPASRAYHIILDKEITSIETTNIHF